MRIKVAPAEPEIDGISLARYVPGSVREVSATIGSWLIAEGYADPEMRACASDDEQFFSGVAPPPAVAHDRRKHNR